MSSFSGSDADDPEDIQQHNARSATSFPGAAKCMSMFHRDAKRPSNKEKDMMGLCRRVDFKAKFPKSDERVFTVGKRGRKANFYEMMIMDGFRFPCHEFVRELCAYYGIAASQLVPNSWKTVIVYWSSIPNVTRINNIDDLQFSEKEERQCAYLVDDEQQIHSPAHLSLFSHLILAGLSPWPIIDPKVGEFPVMRCDALFFDGKRIIVNTRGREGLNLIEYRASKDEYTIMNLVDGRLVPEEPDEYLLPPLGRPGVMFGQADPASSVPPTDVTVEVAPEGMVSAATIKAAQKKA
ncbi:hypothetical protein COLO4_23961 [Corchorus olitorius]|uniref:Transposase (putative) gypsy type domain-containing protein n=1 Tax=Corchorus olitorius TaxID=93759 RepID=A0A1R3IDR6_9ROSI|nr:hypothetical protein COLO4_23961 [Corchorus olitorius]